MQDRIESAVRIAETEAGRLDPTRQARNAAEEASRAAHEGSQENLSKPLVVLSPTRRTKAPRAN